MYNSLITGDMVRQYGYPQSFSKDFQTIYHRVENEGFSFLSKTLPKLGKAIDTALVQGVFTTPEGFKKPRGSSLPCFLQVLLRRVFKEDGYMAEEPCTSAVKDLRQITYLCYKYEAPYDETTIASYLDNFIQTDVDLGWETPEEVASDGVYRHIIDRARTLICELVGNDEYDFFTSIRPAHGPGAVATGEKNWEKMQFKRKYDCIHQKFPYYTFFVGNAMDLASRVNWYRGLEHVVSGISKTTLVPKDSRGPRMICMEPLEFQYIQQGILRSLVPRIQRHPLTRGHVNFDDQEVNRTLALRGSMSGDIVTLDMKEASDRISLWLVRELFADNPWFLSYLEATRTEATELPDGRVHLMRKYAPMGSALCFPIESLVHWSLAVASLHVIGGVSIKSALQAVYVYGDDIVIKGENHTPLFDAFPHFGLRFNEAKCCTTGHFRESCGMDAFRGEPIIPTKVKKATPRNPYDATGYVSYLSYCNSFWQDAYYTTSLYVERALKKFFGRLPHVQENSDAPGLVTRRPSSIFDRRRYLNRTAFKRRWNKKLQRAEIKVLKTRAEKYLRPCDRSEYHRKLMIRSDEFVAGVYTVPHSIKLEKGWSASCY
jgi:hypothetical protein